MQSSEIRLRPHHGLCIGFFEGKGYSPDFTEHMTEVIARLQASDPIITLSCSCDIICSHCPNARGSSCSCEEKVTDYDRRVLTLIGASEGTSLPWSRFFSDVRKTIVAANRLPEVCGDCQWKYICSKKCP